MKSLLAILVFISCACAAQSQGRAAPGAGEEAVIANEEAVALSPEEAVTLSPEEAAAVAVSSVAFRFRDAAAAAPGNVVFSPYSLYTAFAMVGEGAREDTAAEIRGLFGIPEDSGTARTEYYAARRAAASALKGLDFVHANALWYQRGYAILPDLERLFRKGYAAAPQNSDFRSSPGRAVNDINSWVSRRTRGNIRTLFQPDDFDRMTRLVLASAVNFKGRWRYAFREEAAAEGEFSLSEGSTTAVQFYRGGPWPLPYSEAGGARTAALDYSGGKLRMLLMLPAEGSTARELFRDLTPERLADIRSALKPRPAGLDISLPAFKTQSSWDLVRELTPLGLAGAFSPEADYSGLTGRKTLVLQKAVQVAALEVGSGGASSPSRRPGRRGRPLKFTLDRPFVFIVEEKSSGFIIFMGLVENPGT